MKKVVLLKLLLAATLINAAAPGLGYYGQYSTMGTSGNTIETWGPTHSVSKIIAYAQKKSKLQQALIDYPMEPFGNIDEAAQAFAYKVASMNRLSVTQQERIRSLQIQFRNFYNSREVYRRIYSQIEPTLIALANRENVQDQLMAMYLIKLIFPTQKIAKYADENIKTMFQPNTASIFETFVKLRKECIELSQALISNSQFI